MSKNKNKKKNDNSLIFLSEFLIDIPYYLTL